MGIFENIGFNVFYVIMKEAPNSTYIKGPVYQIFD